MEENNTSASSSNGGSKKGLIIAVVAVIVILAVAAGGFAFLNKDKLMEEANESAAVENAESQVQAQVTPEAMQQASPSANVYKDGTYEATGTYSYHSGTESVKVSVTLKDNMVEEVDVTTLAKNPTSKQMQADFAANYKTMVVGKNINEVKLGKVSGSSLTPIGFNAAIEDIKSQAKS